MSKKLSVVLVAVCAVCATGYSAALAKGSCSNSVMSVGDWRTVNVPREVQPNVRSITVEQIQ